MSDYPPNDSLSNLHNWHQGEGQTVLLVRTDSVLRREWADQLEQEGLTVLEAADGKEAWELIKKKEPQAVLCDRLLPAMEGLELCRRIKEKPETGHIYVVVIMNAETSRDRQALDEVDADGNLPLDCPGREMTQLVRTGLRIAHLEKGFALRNQELQQLTERLNKELETVSNIQKALLPQSIPRTPAFDFTAFYLPSTECSGDYYDLIQLDEKRQGFVIADVSGHGAPAMVTMALLRQNFHLISGKHEEPHTLLEEMNRLLFDHLPTDQYVTMHYCIFNTETLGCRYASAGHNPPLHFKRATGKCAMLEKCESFPLKLVMREATYQTNSLQLEKGDKLVFYTDGIPECFNHNKENYEMERFQDIVDREAPRKRVSELEMTILTDVMTFADGRPFDDDLTLAIVGVYEQAEAE